MLRSSRPIAKVEKPWGIFDRYTHNLTSTVKIIMVASGSVLSRQYHAFGKSDEEDIVRLDDVYVYA